MRTRLLVITMCLAALTSQAAPLFTDETKLTVNPTPGLAFGRRVAISGDTIVSGGSLTAAAFVFMRNGSTWTAQPKLTSSDVGGVNDALFGDEVAISGDTIVVGNRGGSSGGGMFRGAAYVFGLDDGSWTQEQKLTASDATFFGQSVAVSGFTVVVGARGSAVAAPGAAYVFVNDGNAWTNQQKLTASDAGTFNAFGQSVAVSGDTVVVGAPEDDNSGGVNAGAAYVFVRDGNTWTEQDKLVASDAETADFFGFSVSISGDTIVVGALNDDNFGGAFAGAAYVFVRSGTIWTEQQKLTASNAAEFNQFGRTVGISSNTVVIGGRGVVSGVVSNLGSAYVFVRSGTNWTEQEELTANDAAAEDDFGSSLAIDGDAIVAGSPGDDNAVRINAGAAYVFERSSAVELVALEVVQTIQDWRNSVPLVANKRTFVRAHYQKSGESVECVTGKLRGFHGATELLPPQMPINQDEFFCTTTNAAAARKSLQDSLNFKLPPAWVVAGTLTLVVEPANIFPPVLNFVCKEPAESGGASNDCTVSVTFTETPPLALKLFVTQPLDFFESSFGDLDEVVERVKAIFPINTVEYTYGHIFCDFDNSGVIDQTRADGELFIVNLQLETQRIVDQCTSDCNRIYVAVLRGPDRGGQAPGDPAQRVCSGTLVDGDHPNRTSIPHEIGHVLGREHAVSFSRYGVGPCQAEAGLSGVQGACGECAFYLLFPQLVPEFPYFFNIGGSDKATLGPTNQLDVIFGLDTQVREQPRLIDPEFHFELMSYCKTPGYPWISKYTYEAILGAINSTFSSAVAPQRQSAAAIQATQEYLLVRGMIHLDTDVAEFLPFVSYSSDVAPPAPAAGEYELQLLDALGDVVTQVSFQPSPGSSHSLPLLTSFLIAVPADPAIRQAVVRHNGVAVVTRAASLNPPTVHVLSPNGGENIADDPVVLSWDAADADGDPLTYVVQYSADGGATFETLAVDWPHKTFTLSHGFFKGSDNALIRVTASDGFNTATDESDAVFTVGNNRPELLIRAPSEGEMFFGNSPIFLEAFALDREDGELSGASLKWTSNLDGALGNGKEIDLQADQLSEGTHLITVIATDSGALSGTSSVHVVIARQVPATLADLLVTKEARTDTVAGGTDLRYTITVNNQGPSAATGVMLTDTLPPSVGVISVMSSQGNCTPSGNTILCNIGNLASGSNATATVVVRQTVDGSITNTVTVASNDPDPVPANNAARAISTVRRVDSQNHPPVAQCKNVTVSAGANCVAAASIDDGSFDPDAADTITRNQSPPGPYGLGMTTVMLTVIDNHGASDSCNAVVTVVDVTPPTVTCTSNRIVNATSPAAAVVIFPLPTASDNCSMASRFCNPSSGSTFALGTTTVTCRAIDGSANTNTCAFTVRVKGAAEQINDLTALIQSFNLKAATATSLIAKLQDTSKLLSKGNTQSACAKLQDFINEVNAQAAKKQITADRATQMIADATRIRGVISCR